MSFLGSIVDSIGGDKAPPPPPKPPSRPNSANTARTVNGNGKSAPRPGGLPTPVMTGAKRKAEDVPSTLRAKSSKPNTPTETSIRRVAAPPLNAPKPQQAETSVGPKLQPDKIATNQVPKPVPAPDTNAAKAVPKGSYAEMMARAKQSAEQRAQSHVGTIKHQETKKDKMSKLAEKRKMVQDRANGPKPGLKVNKDEKKILSRSASPMKQARPQPTKAATTPPKPGYKGTMGMGASRSRPPVNGRPGAKKPKYDEYLGTDEEDNSDLVDDEDGYGSDASSDMEAGFDDMEIEDTKALRQAKEDDAREQALESQLKREKEERRKRLAGLAKKHG